MARTLLDFAKSLEKRAAALPDSPNAAAIAMAMAIVRDFAWISPVDTSLFVSNWQVTLGARPESPRPAYFYGEAGSTRFQSINEMIEDARRVLMQKQPGQPIYISNCVPYAKRLDEGWAKQGPIGFRARAALIARKMAEKHG